jgi:hypothetical protein
MVVVAGENDVVYFGSLQCFSPLIARTAATSQEEDPGCIVAQGRLNVSDIALEVMISQPASFGLSQ